MSSDWIWRPPFWPEHIYSNILAVRVEIENDSMLPSQVVWNTDLDRESKVHAQSDCILISPVSMSLRIEHLIGQAVNVSVGQSQCKLLDEVSRSC